MSSKPPTGSSIQDLVTLLMSIVMEPLKQEAINVIAGLPDDADMEELMYRLYVLENIRRGQEDAEKGKTMPVEVLRDIQSW